MEQFPKEFCNECCLMQLQEKKKSLEYYQGKLREYLYQDIIAQLEDLKESDKYEKQELMLYYPERELFGLNFNDYRPVLEELVDKNFGIMMRTNNSGYTYNQPLKGFTRKVGHFIEGVYIVIK